MQVENNNQNNTKVQQQSHIIRQTTNQNNKQPTINRQTSLYSSQTSKDQQKFYSFQANRITIRDNTVQQNKISKIQEKQPNNIEKVQQIVKNEHHDQNKEKDQQINSFQQQNAQLKNISEDCRKACHQITQQLLSKAYIQQIRKDIEKKITPIYNQFCKAYQNLTNNIEIAQSINTYVQTLVKYWNEEMFFQHFIQNRYLNLLMVKIRQFKYADDIVKAVFGCLEYLLKGLGSDSSKKGSKQVNSRQQQFIYLLVIINREGFITENYKFTESQDWAYYAHFMKLLIRIINQADKAQQLQVRKTLSKQKQQHKLSQAFTFLPQKKESQAQIQYSPQLKRQKTTEYEALYSKYLSIFFNQKIPEFPILLKLLYFYKWPDAILQTSVKLCLLQISNHPNRRLQKYFLNFPFVTFYLFYCTKISDNVEKYLSFASLRGVSQKLSQKQEIALQQITTDIKFMQDYLKIQQQVEASLPEMQIYKTTNIQQHLSMYINTFFYYIGRSFYQQLQKFIHQQNTRGIMNGILLIIKIMSMNTITKIKIGFEEMFHKYINCDLFDYLRMKRDRLSSDKYWIFQQCQAEIREHAQNILFFTPQDQDTSQYIEKNTNYSIRFSEQKRQFYKSQLVDIVQHSPSPSKIVSSSTIQKTKKQSSYSSIFKTMSSYIPTTNSNWLYYEMKKISQVLGLEVALNKEINHDPLANRNSSYYKGSFVSIIDKIQQNHLNGNNNMVLKSKMSLISRFSSPIKHNPLFSGILSFANKGVLKYPSGRNLQSQNNSKKIYQDTSQQLIYYYIIMLCSFKQFQNKNLTHEINNGESNINLQQISQLLKITKSCKSLMLVGMMYWYIKTVDYQLQEKNNDFVMPNQQAKSQINKIKSKQNSNQKSSPQKQVQKQQTIASELLDSYIHTLSKLVYYALTEGWQSFIKHTKQIKKIIWNKSATQFTKYLDTNFNPGTQFSNDIFRDIECDIVYFVMLRHIFGTKNSRQELNQELQNGLEDSDVISKQIKVPCRLTNSQGDQVYLVMDGQYIKFITMDDVLITKKPLTISSFNVFYQQRESSSPDFGEKYIKHNDHNHIKTEIKQKIVKKVDAVFQLVDIRKTDSEIFTVYFQQVPIRQYVARQIKWRKKIIMDIQMSLRSMRIDIEQ